jgi:hypothetical protein
VGSPVTEKDRLRTGLEGWSVGGDGPPEEARAGWDGEAALAASTDSSAGSWLGGSPMATMVLLSSSYPSNLSLFSMTFELR